MSKKVKRFKVQLKMTYPDAERWFTRFAPDITEAERLMVGMVGDFVNGTAVVVQLFKDDNRIEDAAGIKRGEFAVIASIVDMLTPKHEIVGTLDASKFIREHAEDPRKAGKEHICGCLQMFDRDKGETWKKCETVSCVIWVSQPLYSRQPWLKPSRG